MPIPVNASLDFQSATRILNLPAPASANEPARLADLNAALEGLAWKDNCRVAAQVDVTLSAPGAMIDGAAMLANDRVLLGNQTTTTEQGIYIWNGAAIPMTRALDASTADELESAVVTIDEGTSAGATYRQTTVDFVLGTGSPVFVSFGTSAPVASETVAGIVELATQDEADTGVDDVRAITSLKLANWSGRAKRGAVTLGDGAATSYVVTHNLNTRDVITELYRNSGNYDEGLIEIQHNSLNSVTVIFAAAPALNSWRLVVLG
ncbi:MAG: hypothetical protein Q8R10_19605 [Pseudomonas sp.]|uniref:hypothetical protein n=1 Tax=Pseudomonas sp. TaxID=306 RepID=UPI002733B10A|nr:hypothetical protein [Pseudomonas sp.]MDP3848631.1 hypothetical protein [Pseudomonas sp.]